MYDGTFSNEASIARYANNGGNGKVDSKGKVGEEELIQPPNSAEILERKNSSNVKGSGDYADKFESTDNTLPSIHKPTNPQTHKTNPKNLLPSFPSKEKCYDVQ